MHLYRSLAVLLLPAVLVSCKPGMVQPGTGDLLSTLATSAGAGGMASMLGAAVGAGSASGVQNNLASTVAPEKNGIQYIGFAKDFMPVKNALKQGSLGDLQGLYQQRLSIKKNNLFDPSESDLDLLGMTELADLYLLEGDSENAIKSFSIIEKAFADREDESVVAGKSKSVLSWLGDSVVGSATFSEYDFQGFEKVLILNLKSIAYLLDGDRKAYNVARKAIDLQGSLRDEFGNKLKESKNKLDTFEQDIKQKQVSARQEAVVNTGQNVLGNVVDKAAGFKGVLGMAKNLNKYFISADKKGSVLPSAYVNPFGDYMNGVVQEFDSLKNSDLKTNALRSYEKAKALNPSSKVIKANIKALKKRRPLSSSKRLVHFVVGDGFAPEKKVLLYNVPAATGTMPVRIPIYESDPLALAHRISITAVKGKKVYGRMSVVANVDALCLRSQKDRRTEDLLDLSASVARTFFEKEALKGLGVWGQIAGNLRDKYTEVDTRSWLSLPSSLLAARLEIPKSVKKVRFIAFDKKFRRLIDKVIDLPEENGFMYARVLGKSLYVNKSAKLWIDG